MKWRSLAESDSQTDQRPLREIFAGRKDLIAKYVPADVQAVHEDTVATLKQQRLAAKALAVGAHAPSFELPDHNGKLFLLRIAEQGTARSLLHPRTLVPVLRRPDGSDE